MGHPCARLIGCCSSFSSSRRASRAELDHHLKETEELSEGVRWIPRREDRRYGTRDVKRLLSDAGIVGNRLKIAATIQKREDVSRGARRVRQLRRLPLEFCRRQADQKSLANMAEVPARTTESDAMSRDLLRRGFKFVGSTIC